MKTKHWKMVIVLFIVTVFLFRLDHNETTNRLAKVIFSPGPHDLVAGPNGEIHFKGMEVHGLNDGQPKMVSIDNSGNWSEPVYSVKGMSLFGEILADDIWRQSRRNGDNNTITPLSPRNWPEGDNTVTYPAGFDYIQWRVDPSRHFPEKKKVKATVMVQYYPINVITNRITNNIVIRH